MFHLPLRWAAPIIIVAGLSSVLSPAHAGPDKPKMTVYKSPSCGCCVAWVGHLRDAGYEVEVRNQLTMTPIKKQLGVPSSMWACHTAVIDGRIVEGHVPAEAVDRLLADKTGIYGIAVPGMPMGSPGMGDDENARFDVLTFKAQSDAESEVFQRFGK